MDRLTDVINTAGYKVWPREVEAALMRHPAVVECLVVGQPEPIAGEQVVAYVVPQHGVRPAPEALIDFCRRSLAAYKVPRRIELVADLPLGATGKPVRERRLLQPAPEATDAGRPVSAGEMTEPLPGLSWSAEAALRASEQRFRATFEQAAVGMAHVALDGRWLLVNQRLCDILGYSRTALLGLTFQATTHPEDLAADLELVDELIRGQRSTYSLEKRYCRQDGGIVWANLTVSLVREVTGQPSYFIAVIEDIGARKALEAELERRVAERTAALNNAARRLAAEIRRREEAQVALLQTQKLEALGQLTGGVAHDFNNLLAGISGSLELIERRTDDPRLLRHIQNARQSASRASHLTGQLLAFARRQELAPMAVALPELLERIDSLLRQAIGASVRLVVTSELDLWSAHVDPQQLEVALLNLAVNARDAMPDGGTLTIAARNVPASDRDRPAETGAGDYVVLAVRDTGQGMAPEVLARVLEPFFTTKGRGRGTGLGLPMVHGFVRQSGGALRMVSRLGAGTTVELFLPRSGEAIVAAPTEAAAIDLSRHGQATVLVVDDDDQVLPVAAALLRDLGYTVIEAPDAETAFALAHAVDGLDLVVTDVVMPGVDGPTLAARLRAVRPGLPVLFITGHAEGAALETERVLRKPFTLAELAARTLAALGRDDESRAEASGGDREAADRLLARLRSPALRALYHQWRELGRDGALPPFQRFAMERTEAAAQLFIATVEGDAERPNGFRYLHVGRALTERLGRSLDGERVTATASEEALGALEAAYRRCCRLATPTHEYARFDLGDGAPVLFERLLVPFSADGQTVTHLVGMAQFTDL